jgi:hypothetical protein
MNLLEAQTWMSRVVNEATIGGTGPTPDIGRQCGQQLPKVRRDVGFHSQLKLCAESVRVEWRGLSLLMFLKGCIRHLL